MHIAAVALINKQECVIHRLRICQKEIHVYTKVAISKVILAPRNRHTYGTDRNFSFSNQEKFTASL